MRPVALAAVLIAVAGDACQAAPVGPGSVFDRLVGTWTVDGTTRGRPTSTGAEARSELGGTFTELHIKDPRGVDRYEARVFFGKQENGELVVHWLDGTGGETSRTLGSGAVNGDVVTITFAYPDGTFRDTFAYDRINDRWRLLILTGPRDHPRTFSDWRFDRAQGR